MYLVVVRVGMASVKKLKVVAAGGGFSLVNGGAGVKEYEVAGFDLESSEVSARAC